MEANISKLPNNLVENSTPFKNSSSKLFYNNSNISNLKADNTIRKKSVTFSNAWHELKSSPKELYLIFILKFLESYSYFAIIYTLIIFLSDEYKYTDEEAGWSYGIFGMCTSLYGFIFGGFLIDNLGVRVSLILGCSILLVGRLLLVVSSSNLQILVILYTILPIGTCLGIPVMQIAIRRYTTENSRSLAFSIFYGMMNISAIFSASSIDFCRRFLIDKKINLFGLINFELTPYRSLFLFGVGTTLISLIISFFLNENEFEKPNENGGHKEDTPYLNSNNMNSEDNDGENRNNNMQMDEENLLISKNNLSNTIGCSKNINYYSITTASSKREFKYNENSDKNGYLNQNKIQGNITTIDVSKKKMVGPISMMKEVTSQRSFWKFVFTIILLMGVRIVYRHLDATFPKYMIREFGKDVMYGSIIAINPFLIVILIPVFAPLAYQFSAYSQIAFGALLTAISPFFLVIGPYLWSSVMFVVILSIGEALWSPRLYEYTIFITEKGREGIYMALASSPMFLATLITGATSGILLDRYCPEKGERESWKMWLYIGIITLSSPIFLFMFKNKIEITDNELNEERIEREKKKIEEEEKLKNLNYGNSSQILVNFNHFKSTHSKFKKNYSQKNLVITNNIEFDIKVFQIDKQAEFSMTTNEKNK